MRTFRPFLLTLLVILATLVSACSGGDEAKPSTGNPDTADVVAGSGDSVLATSVPNVASQLNAGEIDDNATWSDYQQYRDSYLIRNSRQVHDVDVSERQTITVTDGQDLPILGARVMVYGSQELIAEYQTDSAGQAQFFPKAWAAADNEQSLRVVVQYEQSASEFYLSPGRSSAWHVVLDEQPSGGSIPLDVVFLLDATGSMRDEIEQLQDNILAISFEIDNLPADTDVRYGLVTYRDRGDEYVTRQYDFVSDVQAFQEKLNEVEAKGGGDNPESLNEALHVAVQEMGWRDEGTIKLVFLVADAPPHLDYANDYDYVYEMIAASWNGIKVHPIASSGLPENGEFIFRQIAQYTQGHFIFLTYENGNSGAAGSSRTDLEAGDSNFTVEQLDDLVLQLILSEIEALDVPVENGGETVQLSDVDAVSRNELPPSFSLSTSAAAGSRTFTTAQSEEWTNTVDKLEQVFTIILGFLVVAASLVVMIAMIGLGNRRREGKRKRKNEELWLGYGD